MYRCPHCSTRCFSLWRRLTCSRTLPLECSHCSGRFRVSDRSRVVEALGAEVLALAFVIAFLFWPWWAAAAACAVAVAGLTALGDMVFPLVAAEPFGSEAYTRRAGMHLWLVAPIALAVVIIVVVTMVKGGIRAG